MRVILEIDESKVDDRLDNDQLFALIQNRLRDIGGKIKLVEVDVAKGMDALRERSELPGKEQHE